MKFFENSTARRPNKTGDNGDPWDSPLPALRNGPQFPSSSIAIRRLPSPESTHFATPGSASFRVCLTSSLEVFGNIADTSSIRTAVCCLFFLFSRTLLISHNSASDVFRLARDPCCPGCQREPFVWEEIGFLHERHRPGCVLSLILFLSCSVAFAFI
jgi:hypothetical protein